MSPAPFLCTRCYFLGRARVAGKGPTYRHIWDNYAIFWDICVIKDIFAVPATDVGINMKPCNVCIDAFGEPACNPAKHCSVEDVPGLSPEEALAFVVSAKPLFDISPSKIVLKVAQD